MRRQEQSIPKVKILVSELSVLSKSNLKKIYHYVNDCVSSKILGFKDASRSHSFETDQTGIPWNTKARGRTFELHSNRHKERTMLSFSFCSPPFRNTVLFPSEFHFSSIYFSWTILQTASHKDNTH